MYNERAGSSRAKSTVRSQPCQLYAESVAKDLQTLAFRLAQQRELHGMDFHGQATAFKPVQWCKAHSHWTLKQWEIWHSNGRV
ncbi:unnamed protein product [Staurois parvus]|uniref:Uncharacterized protein n=1 Tax=Staurois parvus TaxID=386267 RepID=A0ABN9AFU9_9NEOB|nr:unnamed protein product [Staurois parvus]